MAFPTLRSQATHSTNNSTSQTANIAPTVVAGDLLLMIYGADAGSSPTLTWDNVSHGTWTTIYEEVNGGGSSALHGIRAKIADGTEGGGTLGLTLSVGEGMKSICLCIQDWEGSIAGGLFSAFSNEGLTTTPNPPNLSPGVGAADIMWISACVTDNNNNNTSYSANYTDNQIEVNPGAHTVSLMMASRELNASSEDPGVITNGTSRSSYGITVGIVGGGVAGPAVTITDAGDELYKAGDSVVITGANFEPVKGTGSVLISPTDSVSDGSAVAQTDTAWATGSITVTINRGALAFGTQMFLFVINDSGDSNVNGYAVQFEPFVQVNDTLEDEAGSIVVSDTGISASIWRNRAPSGAPDQEITGLSTDGAGLLQFEIANTGLTDGDPIYLMLYEDDAVNWHATALKVIPDYL